VYVYIYIYLVITVIHIQSLRSQMCVCIYNIYSSQYKDAGRVNDIKNNRHNSECRVPQVCKPCPKQSCIGLPCSTLCHVTGTIDYSPLFSCSQFNSQQCLQCSAVAFRAHGNNQVVLLKEAGPICTKRLPFQGAEAGVVESVQRLGHGLDDPGLESR